MPLPLGKPEFFEAQVQRFSVPGKNSHVHVLLHSTNGNNSVDLDAVERLEPFKLADKIWISACRTTSERLSTGPANHLASHIAIDLAD